VKLLLDTHALLWWLDDDTRLSPTARELIADPANDVLVSAVSLWEIVVKARIGKLDADIADILRVVDESGFTRLGVTDAHLRVLRDLPQHHRDPFDHLLIAQAMAEHAEFCSADAWAQAYGVRLVA
jgi:PIN domain nuclease of toxin-antitoxin system